MRQQHQRSQARVPGHLKLTIESLSKSCYIWFKLIYAMGRKIQQDTSTKDVTQVGADEHSLPSPSRPQYPPRATPMTNTPPGPMPQPPYALCMIGRSIADHLTPLKDHDTPPPSLSIGFGLSERSWDNDQRLASWHHNRQERDLCDEWGRPIENPNARQRRAQIILTRNTRSRFQSMGIRMDTNIFIPDHHYPATPPPQPTSASYNVGAERPGLGNPQSQPPSPPSPRPPSPSPRPPSASYNVGSKRLAWGNQWSKTSIRLVCGDLLQAEEDYILHQIPCYTDRRSWHIITKMMLERLNYAAPTQAVDSPGKITVKGNGKSERYIVNLENWFEGRYCKPARLQILPRLHNDGGRSRTNLC